MVGQSDPHANVRHSGEVLSGRPAKRSSLLPAQSRPLHAPYFLNNPESPLIGFC
jgi:hypothetical protein